MRTPNQTWLFTNAANTILGISSWTAFVSLLLVIAASAFNLETPIYFGGSTGVKALGLVVFGVLCGVVFSQFLLWFSMMWFCLKHDQRSLPTKALSLVAQFCFLSFASAVVYFIAYSPQFKQWSSASGQVETLQK